MQGFFKMELELERDNLTSQNTNILLITPSKITKIKKFEEILFAVYQC